MSQQKQLSVIVEGKPVGDYIILVVLPRKILREIWSFQVSSRMGSYAEWKATVANQTLITATATSKKGEINHMWFLCEWSEWVNDRRSVGGSTLSLFMLTKSGCTLHKLPLGSTPKVTLCVAQNTPLDGSIYGHLNIQSMKDLESDCVTFRVAQVKAGFALISLMWRRISPLCPHSRQLDVTEPHRALALTLGRCVAHPHSHPPCTRAYSLHYSRTFDAHILYCTFS